MLQRIKAVRMRDIAFKKLEEFSRKEERSVCELIRIGIDDLIEKLEEKYEQKRN